MTKLIRRVGPDEFLFLALLAVVATIVGYRFGFGNQVEQLPIVMRLLDSSYLTNDFYVESASKFGPRFYYAHIVAGLAWFAPLSVVLFGLTLLVNLALVAISHFATRRLLGGDKIAGFVAATLVIAVSSFALGMVTDIRFVDFQPGSLAIPFALAAFWAGLERRPILAGTLAAVASVPHPLYGVEAGAIALATALVSGSFTPSGGIDRSSVLRSIAWSLAGAIVLAASTVVLWVLPMIGATGERIPTSELFSILAELRAPHHYLPSHFPLRHYASFAAFGIAAALAWTAWRRAGSGSGATRSRVLRRSCDYCDCVHRRLRFCRALAIATVGHRPAVSAALPPQMAGISAAGLADCPLDPRRQADLSLARLDGPRRQQRRCPRPCRLPLPTRGSIRDPSVAQGSTASRDADRGGRRRSDDWLVV